MQAAGRFPLSGLYRNNKLISDYLSGSDQALSLAAFSPDEEGLKKSIESRTFSEDARERLTAGLLEQYKQIGQEAYIAPKAELLKLQNTFTVTAAHQPNLMTGPMYTLHKISCVIRLCEDLNRKYPEKNFIPVFWCGSEDHDAKELNHFYAAGKTYEWNSYINGHSFGMSPSNRLEAELIDWKNAFPGPQTEALWKTVQEGIRKGENMAGIHFRIIHHLFSGFGLLVVLQHLPTFKRALIPLLKQELKYGFSHAAMQASLELLRSRYHVQANPRPLNLFMHTSAGRERLERSAEGFTVVHTAARFSESEILELAESKPELFSPNVILRPLYQSVLLPDIAFCGGAGEVAYWLELKDVFKTAGVFMPVILLRNSAIILSRAGIHRMKNLNMHPEDLLRSPDELLKEEGMKGEYLIKYNKIKSDILNLIRQIGNEIPENSSMKRSADALYERQQKSLEQFGMKILQEEKRKLETERLRIDQLHAEVFPEGTFQERKLNFLPFYTGLGSELCKTLIREMDPLMREVIVFDSGI